MLTNVTAARGLAEQALESAGYTGVDARAIADHLIDCELRGLGFGGLPERSR